MKPRTIDKTNLPGPDFGHTPPGLISRSMQPFIRNNSAIRAMFEEGLRMQQEFGAENVFDFSLGNPNVPAPGAVEEEKSFDEKLLQEVVDIVSRHLEDPDFSASVLCGESRYSSKQIYRKIKQLTGMSIVEFIRDTRLRKAAIYLSQGKLSVTEVMYKVGFTTASWFAKCFKDKFGVSPSDYGHSHS